MITAAHGDNSLYQAVVLLQRNGPSAYQHVISALEGRRLQQEDEGLQPTLKPLYKVSGIKMLLSSVRSELRTAKSKIPGKTGSMSWSQVNLDLIVATARIHCTAFVVHNARKHHLAHATPAAESTVVHTNTKVSGGA